MTKDLSEDEQLKACAEEYVSMLESDEALKVYEKADVYRDLAARVGLTVGAVKRAMREISAVAASKGAWNLGIRPAERVSVDRSMRIGRLVDATKSASGRSISEIAADYVSTLRQKTNDEVVANAPWPFPIGASAFPGHPGSSPSIEEPPRGVMHPTASAVTVQTYVRDEAVRRWVLRRADGSCECCARAAPFTDPWAVPFLEVHHLKTLADGGSDRVTNTVALCPNCHREMHHGAKSTELRLELLARISGLVAE